MGSDSEGFWDISKVSIFLYLHFEKKSYFTFDMSSFGHLRFTICHFFDILLVFLDFNTLFFQPVLFLVCAFLRFFLSISVYFWSQCYLSFCIRRHSLVMSFPRSLFCLHSSAFHSCFCFSSILCLPFSNLRYSISYAFHLSVPLLVHFLSFILIFERTIAPLFYALTESVTYRLLHGWCFF